MSTLTNEQKNAVEARGKVIVTASAGSGKTFVMIERLVQRILSREIEVDRILALTFTNKAAAQMREKLRRALLDRIRLSDGEQKAVLKRQLEKLPLADIGTFHSFCARLVRSHFFLAEVDPSFTIISPDDARGRELSARACTQAFDELYDGGDEALYSLLSVYFRRKKDKFLRETVLSLHAAVRGESDYLSRLEHAGEETFDDVCSLLFARYTETLSALCEQLRTLSFGGRAAAVAEAVMKGCEALMRGDLFSAAALARELTVPRMPPITKAEGEERKGLLLLSDTAKEFRALIAELAKIGTREEEELRHRDAAARAHALGRLVLAYDAAYSALKREANVLDYNDLEHYALKVLSNPDAAEALRRTKQLVFVDEYQDVNAVQEELLKRIAGEELFLVGDAKQAIYGFRGSNSSFFNEKVHAFGAGALPLTGNFRSADAVLEAVNRVFSPLIAGYLPVHGGGKYGAHRGEVVFHRYAEEEPERTERGVYSVLSAAREETEDALALTALRIVTEELHGEIFDPDAGKMRPVGCGDIAVLARKNSGDAERIVRALSAYHIPVTTSSKVNVFDFYESNLMLNALSYLDNPAQDIPLAAMLLSAVGGFTESDLAAVRLRFRRDTFRDACKKYVKFMADGLSARLKQFYERAETLALHARVRGAAEVMEELLSAGIEAQVAALPDGALRLSRLRRLMEEAETLSVHAFLDKLRATDYRIEYAETGGENAVKVLTMHASKGLEFPVVILASLDAPFHGADRGEVMWSREYGFAPKSYDLENKTVHETLLRRLTVETSERKEREEECNLLYVAMTRAMYRLHMIFGMKEARPPRIAARFSDFIDLNACADYFANDEGELPPLGRKQLVYKPSARALPLTREIVAAMRSRPAAGEDVPVKSSATELMRLQHEETPAFRAEGSGHSAEEGTAYHAFLEHVRFGEDAVAEKERMAREGILPPAQVSLLDDARLSAILDIPCLKGLKGKRLMREQKFLVTFPARDFEELFTSEEEIVFQGAMDLIVEDEDGYTIIDYKDSALPKEEIVKKYALQMKLYRKTLAKIMRISPASVRVRIVNIARGEEIEI